MKIRRYRVGEEDALRQICRDTTLRINVTEYGSELVQKWVSKLSNTSKWTDRMRRKNPFVVDQDGVVLGFAELSETGKIDAFYIHHEWQGKGVGKLLYEAVEAEASRLQMSTLTVDSSIGASGFFKARAFRAVGEKVAMTDGMPSKSVSMQKQLTGQQSAR